jgi:molybdenum cofactor biosynthesis protein B
MGHTEHRLKSLHSVTVGVVSVSTTRTLETDESGHWIRRQALAEGHQVVAHIMVPDKADAIREAVVKLMAASTPQALIITGGTGISPKDVTIEAIRPLFSKELTAFGPIFAQLSYSQIGSAALLSRATAGIIGRTLVFCLPGSLKACRLACETLIFPEIGHGLMHVAES